ncbi:MAG TPA: ROK family protein, partial [Microbacterium sp.]|nr:ROK family protein [Microbacterium sp.]
MRLGFDVGGTKTDAVAVAPTGTVVARIRRPTGWGAEAVVATVAGLTAELADTVGIAASEFHSIGVGMPGQVAPGS